jgi:hypothetical protein
MNSFDERLKAEIVNLLGVEYPDGFYSKEDVDKTVAQIKQIFLEESGIDAILQDLVNLRSNMQHDLIRLGLTSGISDQKDRT